MITTKDIDESIDRTKDIAKRLRGLIAGPFWRQPTDVDLRPFIAELADELVLVLDHLKEIKVR